MLVFRSRVIVYKFLNVYVGSVRSVDLFNLSLNLIVCRFFMEKLIEINPPLSDLLKMVSPFNNLVIIPP